jgi:hypothetical protein
VPVLDGTERLGAVELTFEPGLDPLPTALVAVCERYAHFLASMIATKAAYSDFFDVLRGRGQVTPASELLWSLVPPLVLAGDGFVLGALLEPWNGLGGDAFDYAINDRVLDFAVFDAMGHDLTATGIAAFALATYRASRRAGCDLRAICSAIEHAICEQPGSRDRFVTALIARLDVDTGQLSWVCAGHPAPLLLRAGRFVRSLKGRPAPPLGMRLSKEPPWVARESLEPGDLLLAYTDGLTEARRPGGQLFSVGRLAEFIERQAGAGRPAPETLRRLREAIIDRREGTLHDDATAILVEWHRGSERRLLPQTVEAPRSGG